jgi:O-antigen/teichoic acid export membrane protein
MLLAVPTAILAYGLAPIVPIILAGREFHEIDTIIKLIFMGYPAACVFIFNTFVLFGAERQRRPLALLTLLAALQIGINIVFQSQYGIWGAAISFGIFMIFAAIGSTIFIHLLYAQDKGLVKSITAPIVGSFCSVIILYSSPFESGKLTILVSLLVYFCVIIGVRKFLPGGPRQIQLSG